MLYFLPVQSARSSETWSQGVIYAVEIRRAHSVSENERAVRGNGHASDEEEEPKNKKPPKNGFEKFTHHREKKKTNTSREREKKNFIY